MKRLLTIPILVLGMIPCLVLSQSPSATVSTWKDNFTAAYSVIHDDFGSTTVNGIENYADTIAYNRGIKFTFGAITGSCTPTDWANALTLMSHGHEIMNHSHNHYCGQPVGWCSTNYWDENDFDVEIDQSTALIQANTGHYPRFYIFPFDLHTDTMLTYLDYIDYLGARAGTQSQSLSFANLNDKDFPDPFRVNFFVFAPATAVSDLNGAAQMAIDNGGWAIRELHGVQDASWGMVTETDYRAHMDFCKLNQDAGDLWCATTSEVISYQTQRLSYSLTVNSNIPAGEITIDFVNNNPNLKTALQIMPLTLNVDVDGMSGIFTVYQNGSEITEVTRVGDILTFNADPQDGQVVISSAGCPGSSVCVISHPTGATLDEGQSTTLSASATSSVTPLSYQWRLDGVDIGGATSSTLNLTGVTASDAGDYTCYISNGVENITTNAATIVVLAQTPYGGTAHVIPGRVESEEYDEGGQNKAYYDNTGGNTPNEFRFEDVDIESTSDVGGGYNIGYTATGEWLEYTVQVASTGSYNFAFRVATNDWGTNGISVDMDGSEVVSYQTISHTGGWQVWDDVTASGINLTAGEHIMRVNITGVFNLNYVDVSTNVVDCNGDAGGSAYLDNCSNCVGGNTGQTACTQDCNGDWGGTAVLDNCSNCVGGSTGQVACTQDCNGEWGGTAVLDNCSNCVGGNTGQTACTQDCNGEWGGSAVIDNCSNCVGGSTGQVACTQDCNGDWGGTAVLDNCSNCVGGNTGQTACTQDCNGEWGGTAFTDNCSNCVGGSTGQFACTQDCNGDWGGTAFVDGCSDCVGGNTGQTACANDCQGVPGGSAFFDNCGTCVGGTTGEVACTQDCNGEWGGTALVDNCSNCTGGNTGQVACTQDCNGDWGGTAVIDNCSNCTGGNTGATACTQDCNGEWGGTAVLDNCSNCTGGSTGQVACTQDCNGDWGGTAVIDNCSNCTGGNTSASACTQDCNGDWGGSASLDVCGTCSGGNTGATAETNSANCVTAVEVEQESSLQIYPNPFTNSTNIMYIEEDKHTYELNITDISGKVLETIKVTSNKAYNIGSNYPTGVYIGELQTSEGLKTFRILKN